MNPCEQLDGQYPQHVAETTRRPRRLSAAVCGARGPHGSHRRKCEGGVCVRWRERAAHGDGARKSAGPPRGGRGETARGSGSSRVSPGAAPLPCGRQPPALAAWPLGSKGVGMGEFLGGLFRLPHPENNRNSITGTAPWQYLCCCPSLLTHLPDTLGTLGVSFKFGGFELFL